MSGEKRGVAILGVFVADLAFRAGRMPGMGETIFGSGFKLGSGGKGSNQSVAAARVGARSLSSPSSARTTSPASRGIPGRRKGSRRGSPRSPDQPTGAAFIFVDEKTGENAIIVVAGAADAIGAADVDAAADAIRSAAVFVTQLEQPAAAAQRGLEIARAAGAVTILNPAPAAPVEDAIYALCDYVTPNEHEATVMTGVPVASVDDARKAGDVFLKKGAGAALVTLGPVGALLHTANEFDPGAGLQGGAGGRDHRRGRRLQRRLRRGASPRDVAGGSGSLRLRRRRHFRHPRRYGAVDAAARRGRGAARRGRVKARVSRAAAWSMHLSPICAVRPEAIRIGVRRQRGKCP